MLNVPKAWEVFDKPEKNYFKAGEDRGNIPPAEPLAADVEMLIEIAKHAGKSPIGDCALTRAANIISPKTVRMIR